MGEMNSVSFMFDRVGEIQYKASKATADAMLEAVIDAGGDNVESDEDSPQFTPASKILALSEMHSKPNLANQKVRALHGFQNTTLLSNDVAASLMKLVDLFGR